MQDRRSTTLDYSSTPGTRTVSSSPRSTSRAGSGPGRRPTGSAAERHVLRLRDSSSAAGRRLVLPIEVGVRDDLVRRRSAPRALILRRVRVTDERHVVATRKSAMDRGPDAGIRLRAGHDQASDSSVGQHLLQVGVLEGVAERLVHQRFRLLACQLRDVLPGVTTLLQLLVGVLDPDNRYT